MDLQDDALLRDDARSSSEVDNVEEYPYKYLISPMSNEAENQLLCKPLTLGIALKHSVFSEAVMSGPVFNRGKGTIVIPTKNALKGNIDIMQLGTWKVSCRLLPPRALSYGVIGPISEDEDLSAIEKELNEANWQIVHLRRITKRVSGQTKAALYVIIGFSTKELPAKIEIWRVPFKVRRFVPTARQCYRCQRFGHLSDSCKGKEKDIENLCNEILSKWEEYLKMNIKEEKDINHVGIDEKLAKLMEGSKLKAPEVTVKLNSEQQKLKEAILANYAEVSDGETSDSEDNVVVSKNSNAELVAKAEREKRDKDKEESQKKKEKDKEDRAKQKNKDEDRKEKEKKRTQKGEKRR